MHALLILRILLTTRNRALLVKIQIFLQNNPFLLCFFFRNTHNELLPSFAFHKRKSSKKTRRKSCEFFNSTRTWVRHFVFLSQKSAKKFLSRFCRKIGRRHVENRLTTARALLIKPVRRSCVCDEDGRGKLCVGIELYGILD